jgi:hypothetical protein
MRRSRHVILPCRRHPSYCRAGGTRHTAAPEAPTGALRRRNPRCRARAHDFGAQGNLAYARTGNVPNSRTFGGTAVNRAPLGGKDAKLVKCSTTCTPAASSCE